MWARVGIVGEDMRLEMCQTGETGTYKYTWYTQYFEIRKHIMMKSHEGHVHVTGPMCARSTGQGILHT